MTSSEGDVAVQLGPARQGPTDLGQAVRGARADGGQVDEGIQPFARLVSECLQVHAHLTLSFLCLCFLCLCFLCLCFFDQCLHQAISDFFQ